MIKQIILKVDEEELKRVVKEAVREELAAIAVSTFNKKEAAKYLKISPVTLWTYQRNGWIKSVQVGNREMFTKAELDRFATGDQRPT